MRIKNRMLALALVLSLSMGFGASALADAEAPVPEALPAAETLPVPEEAAPAAEESTETLPEEEAPATPEEEPLAVPEEEAPTPEDTPDEPLTGEETAGETLAPEEPSEVPGEETPAETAPAAEESPLPAEEPAETSDEPLTAEAAEELAAEEAAEAVEPLERPWAEPGNTAAEILGGGRYLHAGGVLYYMDGGLWAQQGGSTRLLSEETGGNLNLSEGWLYYTLKNGDVRRLPADGGAAETVYSFGASIRQMYVMGGELRFIAGGGAWSYDMETGELMALEAPDGVTGLIPTVYGNLYLTGTLPSYTLWAETAWLLAGVEQCWTDSGWLVLTVNGETVQADPEELFAGNVSLQPYSLHKGEDAGSGLSETEQLAREAAFLQSDTYELMQDGLSLHVDGAYTEKNDNIASTAYTSSSLTEDQKNMVLRARQMAEVTWTPLKWRYSWGGDNDTYNNSHSRSGANVVSIAGTATLGYFKGGETYQGIPYSQAVHTGYVGWNLSIDQFVEAVNDSDSLFYSGYSTYSRTAPYYGSDCSGFVSYAWDLPSRCTCTSMLPYGTRIESSLQNLRIGDSLNNPSSHVVLITDIGYDADGYVNAVEITEQTPCKMRVTCYGELFPGRNYNYTGSLSTIQSYYFNGGYSIYRRNYSGSVRFTESNAVNLEESGYASAPLISLTINEAGNAKVVELVHGNPKAVIYYTVDGSTPTTSSTKYTGAFQVTRDTVVKAIADCGEPYTGSYTLTYNVTVQKAEKPFIVLVDGALQDNVVSRGSKVTVQNNAGDAIYYTTDGSTPTRQSSLMTDAGVTIDHAMTFKAVAVSGSNLNSDVAEITVTIGDFHTIKASAGNGGYMNPGGEISVLDGSAYSFEIVAQEYFAVADVLVDGKSVGAVKTYTFENVKGDHTIEAKYSVVLPFSDVQNKWYTESVGFVYSKSLFSGTSSSTFSPTARMTRGMFITVLGRFIGNGQWKDLESWSGCLGVTNGSKISVRTTTTTSDESYVKTLTGAAGQHINVLSVVNPGVDGGRWYGVRVGSTEGYMREKMTGENGKTLLYVYTGGFKDLPNGAYYTGYAQWAYIYGIMNGVSDTAFRPNASITRQDICVMLYRYLSNYTNKSLTTTSDTPFTDDSSISGYARNAVYAMKNIGIINGYTDGSFKPKGYATRAEVAAMFQRLYDFIYG